MKSIEKFLEFNGKRISILNADGTWWVALRPILEALKVDADWHLRAVKQDGILAQHLCDHTGVAADNKARKMTFLPEKYIYGWLFTIKSESIELRNYKSKCYDVLYDHFNGLLTGRINLLSEKTQEDLREKELLEKLGDDPLFQELMDIKSRRKQTLKDLKKWDEQLKGTQGSLFS